MLYCYIWWPRQGTGPKGAVVGVVKRPLMRWFRVRSRPAAYLALFALLLQLALSFGHVHLAHANHPGVAAAEGIAGQNAVPQQPDADHDEYYCAIYAFLALLTSAQIAIAPTVPVPATLAVADAPGVAKAARLGPRRGAFQSRAPPIS
jgi:hypothetical protein